MTRPDLVVVAAVVATLGACGGAAPHADTPTTDAPEYRTVRSGPLIDPTSPPPPGTPRPFSLPTPLEIELANGLDITLIDRPGFPTLSVRVSVDGGYAALPDDMGTTALLARTLRDGAGDWDAVAIARLIDANGIAFSAAVDHDGFRLAADALSTRFDVVVELLSTLLAAPTFPDDRVQARRAELVGELELASARPDYHVELATRRAIFPDGHPYARAWPTIPEVQAVDPAALPATWTAVAGPAVTRVVIVGDLPNDAVARLDAAFGGWSGGPAQAERAPDVALRTCNEAHVVARPNSVQTSIVWLGPGVSVGTDGWFPALVANQVLGGGPSSRLFMNLREDKSFTYGAYSTLEQWGDGVFRAASDVRGDVTAPALDAFVDELSRFAGDPLGDLDDAKAYLSGVFPIEHQTNAQIANRVSWLLDRRVPLEYLDAYRDTVIGTTEGAVREAGTALFDPSELTLVMVGEQSVAVSAALTRASRVLVWGVDGTLVDELPGDLPRVCTSPETSAH